MSVQWDPDKYLTFADQRGRPFLDLVQHIPGAPKTIVDLGCGPGHLTQVLRERWPEARILGVDSSAEMVEKARRDNRDPLTTYELSDAAGWEPEGHTDLIVSNAMFQWIDNQLEVIERLTRAADTIAIQVPNNFNSPSHSLMREVAAWPPYAEHLSDLTFLTGTGANTYLELFGGLGWTVDAWERRAHV